MHLLLVRLYLLITGFVDNGCVCGADFQHEFSTLDGGNLEIVDEMGVVASEETTIEVAGDCHFGDIMIKPGEMGATAV